MTPNDLILLSLKQASVLGVGQTASAEDMSDSFALLNMMLAQWQRKRYMVYHLVETSFPATGAQSYTVGAGGDVDIMRPAKLEYAYMRQAIATPYQVDYPLEILKSREDYDKIPIKGMQSFPRYAFYDSAYPLGNLFIWPIPTSLYSIHITVMEQLQKFATVYDDINMPDEYQEALMYNLAVRMFPMYGLPPNPAVVALAKGSLNTIRNINAQIPLLRMPSDLLGSGHYNVYADQNQ